MPRKAATTSGTIRSACCRVLERLDQVCSISRQNLRQFFHDADDLPLPTTSWLMIALVNSRQHAIEQDLLCDHVIRPAWDYYRHELCWPGLKLDEADREPPVELLRIRRVGTSESGEPLLQVGIDSISIEHFGRQQLYGRLNTANHNNPAAFRLAEFFRTGHHVDLARQDLLWATLLEKPLADSSDEVGFRLSDLLLQQTQRVLRFLSAWRERANYEDRMHLAVLVGDWPLAYDLVKQFAPQRRALLNNLLDCRQRCRGRLERRRDPMGYYRRLNEYICQQMQSR